MSDRLTVLSLSLDSLRSHFVVIFSDLHCCKFVVSHCSVSGSLGLIASFFYYKIRKLRIGVNSFLRIFYGAKFSAQLNFEGPGTVSMLLKKATFSHTTDNDETKSTDESNLTPG